MSSCEQYVEAPELLPILYVPLERYDEPVRKHGRSDKGVTLNNFHEASTSSSYNASATNHRLSQNQYKTTRRKSNSDSRYYPLCMNAKLESLLGDILELKAQYEIEEQSVEKELNEMRERHNLAPLLPENTYFRETLNKHWIDFEESMSTSKDGKINVSTTFRSTAPINEEENASDSDIQIVKPTTSKTASGTQSNLRENGYDSDIQITNLSDKSNDSCTIQYFNKAKSNGVTGRTIDEEDSNSDQLIIEELSREEEIELIKNVKVEEHPVPVKQEPASEQCSACLRTFLSAETLERHLKRCPEYNNRFERNTDVSLVKNSGPVKKKDTTDTSQVLPCPVCKFLCYNVKDLLVHISVSHS